MDGGRHGPYRNLRSQTATRRSRKDWSRIRVLSTFPQIDTIVDNIKFCAGLENLARVIEQGHADPLVHVGRSRLHSPFAASVSVAHRLRPAANRGRAAHRRGDRPHAGAVKSGCTGVHRHWPAVRPGRRRGTEGISHGRFFGKRIRAVLDSVSGSGGRNHSSAKRDEPR